MHRRAIVLAIGWLASIPPIAVAQVPPDKALATFKVADGLKLELFASEPMFVNPTCIDVDHKGRVWVCESVNYRCDLRRVPRNRPEGDRLVVLEDTDGDGKADKAHVFYQEKDFIAPLGIAVAPDPNGLGQRVYVCHSPHVYVFEDKDGDLRADGPPKILLTGFKGYDHDHGVHGIHFGPDGKLYFSVGDQGVDGLKDKNGKIWKTNQTDCRAGTIWRCDADGSNLEWLAHNFRNQYEPAVNSHGTMFVSDNDDDGNEQTRICHVAYGGNYGYWPRGRGESHWHEEQPGVVHKALRTYFGSPTGMCWYEGSLLPKQYHGQLLHTDAGPRHVRCYHVKPKGAGYELEQEVLVSSTDSWFRPSDVCVAPDGSVFVSDWYDPGVGGHGMGDTTRGRIYRLTPAAHAGYQIPPPDFATDAGLRQAFLSANLSAREGARRRLVAMPEPQRLAWCDELEKTDLAIHDSARLGWLRSETKAFEELLTKTYADLETKTDAELADVIKRVVRHYAPHSPFVLMARILRDRYGDLTKAPPTIRNFYRRLVRLNEDAATGREFLLALRDAEPSAAKEWIFDLAKRFDGQDHHYLAAIGIAVGTDPKRREIILADLEKHFPDWSNQVARLVWELRPPGVVAKLDQKLKEDLTAAQRAQIYEILAASEGSTGGLALLRRLSAPDLPSDERDAITQILAKHLPTKWSSLRAAPELKLAVDRMLADEGSKTHGIELVAAAEWSDRLPDLQRIVGDESASMPNRQAAIRAMGRIKTPASAEALGQFTSSPSLGREAIRALGSMQTHESLTPLKLVLLDEKRSEELRNDAIAALAASRQGTLWMLAEHERQALPKEFLPEVGRLLRNSPYPDLRNKAMLAFPAPGKLDVKNLPAIAKLVNRRGDPNHGRHLFVNNKDVACARCHSVRGAGGNIGPDLSMIGKKASRENLFESLMLPDKAIADQFVQWNVLDAKGVTITGLLVEETKEYVIIRDALGKDTHIATKDVEQKAKNAKSIMPSDLLAYLTEQDLVDLVEYLATLTTPALRVESWSILGPFDNGKDDEGLEIEHVQGEAARVEPSKEYAGKHGSIRWRTVRPTAEGYVDLRTFFAPHDRQIASYLHCEIESPVDQPATILIGTDDGCKLWANGELILSHRRHEAAIPGRDQVQARLKQGKNTIVLKINNGDGPHGFYFTVLSNSELK